MTYYIYMYYISYLYIYILHNRYIVIVEVDPKAPFSKTTTPKCKGVLLFSLDCSTYP